MPIIEVVQPGVDTKEVLPVKKCIQESFNFPIKRSCCWSKFSEWWYHLSWWCDVVTPIGLSKTIAQILKDNVDKQAASIVDWVFALTDLWAGLVSFIMLLRARIIQEPYQIKTGRMIYTFWSETQQSKSENNFLSIFRKKQLILNYIALQTRIRQTKSSLASQNPKPFSIFLSLILKLNIRTYNERIKKMLLMVASSLPLLSYQINKPARSTHQKISDEVFQKTHKNHQVIGSIKKNICWSQAHPT